MLAMLGMAVGTGNIWRFPRVAASNGGGSFLVAWVVFLLLWSVPLILVEFAAGKETRRGPLGAFRQLAGPSHTWMGAWIAFVATAIMFYYSVVMGWTIRYLIGSVTASVPMTSVDAANAYWTGYIGSPWAIATHALAMVLGVGVVMRGVKGIENAARVLIPSLLLLVIVLAIRAVTLDGASRGLAFLFTPDWGDLLSARLWLPIGAISCRPASGWRRLRKTHGTRAPAGDSSPPTPCTCGRARTPLSTRSCLGSETTRSHCWRASWCSAPCSRSCRRPPTRS
jgi:NSS family neurotransmitter:Na+ symporter